MTKVKLVEELEAKTGVQRLAGIQLGLVPVTEGRCTIELLCEKLLTAGRFGLESLFYRNVDFVPHLLF